MSRTIRIKVYKFAELSKESQENAIENYRYNGYDNQHYFDEVNDSVKAVVELFGLKTGRTYSDLQYGHIDDNVLNLEGVRLYKYIVNHYWNDLYDNKYIETIDRAVRWKQFVCRINKGQKGEYTHIFSRLRISDDGCPLTGVCYDNKILQPVFDFLKKPAKITFEDLINEIEAAITKTYRDTEDWLNSDEFLKDEIEANEIEFFKDGTKSTL